MSVRRFSFRFSLCYALLMIGAGVQLPFLPLWLHAKHLGTDEIATVLAGMMVSRAIASPLVANLADRLGNRVVVVRTCAALAVCAYLLLTQMNGFAAILAAASIASFAFSAVFPLTESYSINSSAQLGLDYGRLRLWASLSFLSGSLLSGYLLTLLDPLAAIWLLVAGQVSAFMATLILPPEPRAIRPAHDHMFDGESAKKLLFGSQFTLIMISVSLGQSSHAMLNGFSSMYWTTLGISPLMIGVFWSAAVLTEVAFFAFSGRVVAFLGYERLILIGLASGVVRWMLSAFVVAPQFVIPVMMLHAVTFATLHLGTMHYIRAKVPQRLQNTAQGLYGAISGGVFMALMTRLAGHFYGSYGGRGFLFMACISGFALIHAMLVFRFIPTVQAKAA
jgi:MFS transporter, PPP family, 3-phenylpropionic acid transporter